MPDLAAILEFYQAMSSGALRGALAGEARSFAAPQHEKVATRFLSPVERSVLPFLPPPERRGRLRKGEIRFRRWERANPDLVDVLMRKAEQRAWS